MTPRIVTTFRIDDELLEGLRDVQDRDGVLVSEQVRRAIRAWLETKGVPLKKKPERQRSTNRRRP